LFACFNPHFPHGKRNFFVRIAFLPFLLSGNPTVVKPLQNCPKTINKIYYTESLLKTDRDIQDAQDKIQYNALNIMFILCIPVEKKSVIPYQVSSQKKFGIKPF